MSVTASEARARLFPLIEEVNDDQVAVEIGRSQRQSSCCPHRPTPRTSGAALRLLNAESPRPTRSLTNDPVHG